MVCWFVVPGCRETHANGEYLVSVSCVDIRKTVLWARGPACGVLGRKKGWGLGAAGAGQEGPGWGFRHSPAPLGVVLVPPSLRQGRKHNTPLWAQVRNKERSSKTGNILDAVVRILESPL